MKTPFLQVTASRTATLACSLFLGAFAVYGSPIVIVSNLGETPVGVDAGSLDAAAQSFTVNSSASEALQDVQLDLLGTAGAVDVSLYSDNAGLPGSSLLSLGEITPSGPGFADYTVSGNYTLAAGTTYWVVVDYLSAQSWGFTNTTVFTGTGALDSFTNSEDGGATWRGEFFGEPYLLQVDAITPEPKDFVLMLLGVGAMLLIKRRSVAGAR